MRMAAFGLEPRPIFRGEPQRRAVIDGRRAALKLALAAPIELFGGLVARIEERLLFQRLGRRRIVVEPVRLAGDLVRDDAEPGEILDDGALIFGLRALAIRVVEAQQISPAGFQRGEPVEQGRAGIADMEEAGRRGSETELRRGHAALMAERGADRQFA